MDKPLDFDVVLFYFVVFPVYIKVITKSCIATNKTSLKMWSNEYNINHSVLSSEFRKKLLHHLPMNV